MNLSSSLQALCVNAVAAGFELLGPAIGALPADVSQKVTDELSVDLQVELAGQVAGHGGSWKQLWFERNLQDELEAWPCGSDTEGLDHLRRLMAFSRRFVQSLRLQQLPSHLDLQSMLEAMVDTPVLLALTYSLRSLGMDYGKEPLGMRLGDCRALARALGRTETLVFLELSGNELGDEEARMLASGLADNISITHLDLRHNAISDRGAKALAKVLDAHSVVATLDLGNNLIRGDGGRALSRALHASRALQRLELRVNSLGDTGCVALCEALVDTSVAGTAASSSGAAGGGGAAAPLEALGLAANGAGEGLAAALPALLRSQRALRALDVSSNDLGAAVGAELPGALAVNAALQVLDVRGCGLHAEDEAAVLEEMILRRERHAQRA